MVDELEALLNSADNLELMKGRHNSSKDNRMGPELKETRFRKEGDAAYVDHITEKQREIGKRVADILGENDYLPDNFQKLFV